VECNRRLSCSYLLRRAIDRFRRSLQTALEIPDQIIERLDTDREPDRSTGNSCREKFIIVELPVRRAGGMNDERPPSTPMRNMTPQLQALDQRLAGSSSAADVK